MLYGYNVCVYLKLIMMMAVMMMVMMMSICFVKLNKANNNGKRLKTIYTSWLFKCGSQTHEQKKMVTHKLHFMIYRRSFIVWLTLKRVISNRFCCTFCRCVAEISVFFWLNCSILAKQYGWMDEWKWGRIDGKSIEVVTE